ncbi:MAG TPA: DUF423 domain-containing protein [Verrucomicrobiales bacterium]|nr:DUF423 domain-containing protein [Verrucomicrobiales bacterium]
MNHTLAARIAAAFAMLGVAYGAFGAHGLKAQLESVVNGVETWKTAVLYHLIHAVAMYVVAVTNGSLKAWWLVGLGILLFSGSLYTLALWPGMKWLGPVTPVGGVLMIGGWALLMMKWGKE